MERQQQLVSLTRRLLAAEAGADWTALGNLDRELSVALPRLAARGAFVGDESLAFAGLRQAHQRLRASCERETTRLGEHLNGLRQNREGWLAYAMDGQGDGGAA